jgi:hypothetical protein
MEHKQLSIIETSNKKEKKMRVQTHTWDINDSELSYETQINMLNYINQLNLDKIVNNHNKYINIFINNLKNKISGYRQQDILKQKLDIDQFIDLKNVISLLLESNLKCCYCHKEIYILYKHVRDMEQWTLDRIDNNIGHNVGNLVISCLKCNLKRRRINQNSFMITKNMTIKRENYISDNISYENDFQFDESQKKIIYIRDNEKEEKI